MHGVGNSPRFSTVYVRQKSPLVMYLFQFKVACEVTFFKTKALCA